MHERTRVLFLCCGNSARSQMAEALLRHHGGDHYEAQSAGLGPRTVDPLVPRVLEEIGVDAGGLRAQPLDELLGRAGFRYAIILCVQGSPDCPKFFPFASRTLYWPFLDPAAGDLAPAERLAGFRRVRDEIGARVRRFLAEGL